MIAMQNSRLAQTAVAMIQWRLASGGGAAMFDTRNGDADSSDLLTGISRETDQYPWFLEAHLHAKR
jgi:hypothetical protein